MQNQHRLAASFRDPNGFLYRRDGKLLRQINQSYQSDYRLLKESGLFETLVKGNYLVKHRELGTDAALSDDAFMVIEPDLIDYISYPYEWCFSQLKDAALLTLKIQQQALAKGMSLKDASAYNVQFHQGKPIFIDTLSFEAYEQGPWVAYKQFCQHFLAPLALKSVTDRRLGLLLRTNIDGIPLDLASKLLPRRSWFSYSLLAHIHLHARAQAKFADSARDSTASKTKRATVSKAQLKAMIDQLIGAIGKLEPKREQTEWGDYYADTNYLDAAMSHKVALVEQFTQRIQRDNLKVIDMGANNGQFSRVVSSYAKLVVAQDIDEIAVEKNYLQCRSEKNHTLLPLVQDLTNPSPAIGWANTERLAITQRGKVDLILALALIHHIAITNNVPLDQVAQFFQKQCEYLIIEFVPKADSQVRRMLSTREDIFAGYDKASFEQVFSDYFEIIVSEPVQQTERTLYLLRAKAA